MAFTLFLLFIACFPPISFIEATQNGCNTVMTSSSGSFSSPGYPGSYYDNTNCRYTIKMPQDKRIVLTVHGYSMESCCDVLDIFEAGQRIARLTGHHPFTNAHFVSNETQLDLQFTTDGSVIRGGFNASYYSFPAAGPYVIVAEVSTVRQNLSTGLSIAVLDFEPKAKPGHLSFRDLACGYMPSKTSYIMTELAVYNPLQRMLEAVIPMPTAFFGRVSVSGNLSLTIFPLFETDIGRVFLCKLSYYANGYLREIESQRILVETVSGNSSVSSVAESSSTIMPSSSLSISSSVLPLPSLVPSPTSDPCYSYTTLSNGYRGLWTYQPYYQYCDDSLFRLGHRWYRFSGSAGNYLLDSCPLNMLGKSSSYGHCSSSKQGWMAGSLPRQYEGEVSRTVYFASYGNCYDRSTTIRVKNCWSSFYVYRLSYMNHYCNYRYCGMKSHWSSSSQILSPSSVVPTEVSSSVGLVMPTPSGNPCYSYNTLSERSRNVHTYSYNNYCDSWLNGWYRFAGAAGSKLSDRCPFQSIGYNGDGYCGAYHGGWMAGSLPNYYEGVARRRVYFARYGDCHSRSKDVWVRNCGGFYVYYFQNDNSISCNYRYCGMADQWYMTPSSMLSTSSLEPSSAYIRQESSTPAIVMPTTPSLDGCKYYEVLSDQTRSNTYNDWSSNRCDNNLNGWYRFMGDAGNRMASSCPSQYGSSRYFCGSYWQGWLYNSHPNEYEGEVYRTVCFSRSYSCSCEYQKSVKVRNCGNYYVYKLEGVPNCNQRYCGAKDNMASVSCGGNYMRIDLDRRYYNASRYSSITLRDPTCSATTSRAYITLGSIPYLCGGQREQTANKIIYRNKVIMTANQNSDTITRDHDEEIAFKCTFDRDGFASGASFEPVRKISGNETGIGRFTFNFAMYTSQSYASQHYSYPAKVKLRDWLYFQATASVQDNNLVLLIDQCYSTPNMDRNHNNKYFFINYGCPIDKTVKFHAANRQNSRFGIQAFRYLGNTTTVFVHCLVFLCQKSSRDYRCQSGCPGNNVKRARRDLDGASPFASDDSSHSQYYLLEAGPVVLDKEEGSSNKASQGKGSQGDTLLTVVIALVAGVVALAVIVAVLVIKLRRPKATTSNLKEEIGIDHAPSGHQYVNEDEAVDGKEVREERL